jgi:transglutaminase-like putative cysteine protease
MSRRFSTSVFLLACSLMLAASEVRADTCLDRVLASLAASLKSRQARSPDDLKVGEYVKLQKATDQESKSLILPYEDGSDTLEFADGLLPAVAHLKGWDKDGAGLAEMTYLKDKFDFRVPKENLAPLATGNAERFYQIADALDFPLSFKKNENVRFRDSDGRMRVGRFLKQRRDWARIKTESGPVAVRLDEIFKLDPDAQPRTPAGWLAYGTTSEMDFTDPVLRHFLNRGARLMSLPGYRELPDAAKLQALVQYVRTFVPYDNAARYAEDYGLKNFSQVLCAGAGTCRHQATLLAQLLAEAGTEVRLVGHNTEEGYGHRWVEATLSGQTYVVDASSGVKQVLTLEEAQSKAAADSNSFEATYFANPKREGYPDR